MTLLCLMSSHAGLEFAEEGAGDVAFEAAADFAGCEPFSAASFDVGACAWVEAHACADDDVDGTVELAVS